MRTSIEVEVSLPRSTPREKIRLMKYLNIMAKHTRKRTIPPGPELIPRPDAARLFGITEDALRKRVWRKTFPAPVDKGRPPKFSRAEINRLIEHDNDPPPTNNRKKKKR